MPCYLKVNASKLADLLAEAREGLLAGTFLVAGTFAVECAFDAFFAVAIDNLSLVDKTGALGEALQPRKHRLATVGVPARTRIREYPSTVQAMRMMQIVAKLSPMNHIEG